MAIATATLHSTLEELYVCHCSNILGVRSLQALGDVLLNLRVLVVTGIRAPLRAGQTDFSPLSHLPQLQTLDISAEQRNASWGFVNLPSSWSTLAGTLRHLMLRSHDGLTSEGTQVVTSLTSMELLCIENCGLRGLPAGFHALSMLQRLVLNSTNVVGGGLRAIPRLPHLRELHLRSCPHLRQIPGEISQRKSLMVLTLGGGVEQQCVQWSDLTRLTLLRVLELDALGIKAVPKVLCSLQSLRLLSLRRNRFGPASLHNLSALSNLQYLCLSHCNLLEIPPALMHLKRMKIADLSSNPYLMIPAPVTWLASLHHLSRMDLRKSAQTSTGTVWDSLSAGHLIELVILMVMVRGNTLQNVLTRKVNMLQDVSNTDDNANAGPRAIFSGAARNRRTVTAKPAYAKTFAMLKLKL
eukprot:evm.model.scf_768.8 EVM.evm.TU.scf_768.8   scf_768:55155-57246(-)